MDIQVDAENDGLHNKISPRGKYAIFIGVLLNLTSGIQYCWSLLGKQMISDFGWTAVQATRPYSIITLVSSLWSIAAGRWGDSKKPRYPIIFGGCMLGGGLILSSMHQNPLLMCITGGAMLGLSSSSITCNVAASSIKWAPFSKKGLVTGIATCGLALSAVYMTPLINGLLGNVGLRNTFVYMGIAALVLVPLLAFLHPQPDKSKFDQPQEGNNNTAVDNSKYKNTITPNQALKTKELYICALIYFCGAMCGQVLASQATLIAQAQVPEWTGGAMLVIILAVFNALGRFFWSAAGDKIGPFSAAKFMLGIQFVNLLCFNFYTNATTLIIGTAVLGFCFGGDVPLLWGWLTSIYGSKYCGSLQGMVTTVWGLSGTIGPIFAAYLMDTTGSYTSAYIGMAVIVLIGFGATFLIKDQKILPAKS